MSKGSRFDARALAQALLDEAMRADGVALAEVFVREARSWRCEINAQEGDSEQQRAESGVALRVWSRSGGEGFVHADEIANRKIGDLVRAARSELDDSACEESGLIPRLPSGSSPGTRIEVLPLSLGVRWEREQADLRPQGRQWTRDVLRECSSFERDALSVREIWIERAEGCTWIVNSLGRDVSFRHTVGSAGLQCAVETSTMRYALSLEGVENPSPRTFAAIAGFEASSFESRHAAPVPLHQALIVLAPRPAAVWLRWVAPYFFRPDSCEEGCDGRPQLPFRSGFHIMDDEQAAQGGKSRGRYDGEGRAIGRREYLRDGQLREAIADSRQLAASDGDIGPMRRDSFRDRPTPGPLSLAIPSDGKNAEPLIRNLTKGLFVTSLTPRVAPGAAIFLAEVRGHWVVGGERVHPIPPTLMTIDGAGGLGRMMARGDDQEPGPPGFPSRAPSLLFEGGRLESM